MPWRRIAAWLIDWLCILGWVAATAAVGVPLYLTGVIAPSGLLLLNVIGAVVIVVPVVIGASLFESAGRAATPGKRALRLRVESRGVRPSFPRAIARNALKLGVPWLIGHSAAFAISTQSASGSGVTAATWALTAFAYVVPIAYVISLFLPHGRTPYDLVARTEVAPVTRVN
jgi:uncharacterized RDD family membrane protein YckC